MGHLKKTEHAYRSLENTFRKWKEVIFNIAIYSISDVVLVKENGATPPPEIVAFNDDLIMPLNVQNRVPHAQKGTNVETSYCLIFKT